MLILAFALASAVAAPAPEPQRASRVRVARAAARKPLVRTAPVRRDRNAQYRLTDLTPEVHDGKAAAVRQTGLACGVVGAPVCPSKGTALVTTPIDD